MYRLSKFVLRTLLSFFFGLKVTGQENIPKQEGFVLAPNHVSYLDPPVVGSACPRKVHYMAKEELFSVPLLGTWMRWVGTFPVRRGSADRHALQEAHEILRKKECVCVFLEGGITSPGANRNARPGAAFLALQADVPIVPAAILGTNPWHRRVFGFIPWFSRIEVRFGKAMRFQSPEKFKMHSKDFQALGEQVLEKVRELQRISKPGDQS